MGRSITRFWGSDVGILLCLSAVFATIHIATNGQYGFHRDELQTLDDARHLDWGFVAYPPITPLLARLELLLFGTSLVGFRFISAIAVSVGAAFTGLMARELGARRPIQLLAAVAAAISPFSLGQGAVFQYVSLDYLWCVTATYLLVRLLKSDDPRWWAPIGAVLGLGMETRYTIGFLALGIAGAVVFTPARRFLRSGWLWLGVALSILIILPNLIWQARHGFISLEFLSYLHARDFRQGRYRGFLPEQLWLCVNIVTVPLAVLGLWFYCIHAEGRRYRLLGWTFVVSFALFALRGSRSYYAAPLYPMLLAAGSVLFQLRPAWSRVGYRIQWCALVAGGVAFALIVMPLAPFGSRLWRITSKMHDQFREEIGW
ncbi:MAG: glycosyltransferase family 39 protein, partial [Acidobacteriia bacterium]|nr:glycosyltransferase family 39 protein [Terriglobia bacterium]